MTKLVSPAKFVNDNKTNHGVAISGPSHSNTIITLGMIDDVQSVRDHVAEKLMRPSFAYLYHAGCADGITACLVHMALRRLNSDQTPQEHRGTEPTVVYVPVNYNQEPPELPDTVEEIVVFDFSFDEQVLIDAYPKVSIISQYDHHKSALERATAKYSCVKKDCLKHSLFNFSEIDYDQMPSGTVHVCAGFYDKPPEDADHSLVWDESAESQVDVVSIYNDNQSSGAGLSLLYSLTEFAPEILAGGPWYDDDTVQVTPGMVYSHLCNIAKDMMYSDYYVSCLKQIIRMAGYAQDRDLWLFEHGDSTKAYNLWLMDTMRARNTAYGPFETIVSTLLAGEDDIDDRADLTEILEPYALVVEYDTKRKEAIVSNAEKIIDSKGRVAYICAYTGKDASDMADILLSIKKDAEYVMMYSVSSSEVYWAVRSRNKLAKVVATEYGGGGHEDAAGFKSSVDILMQVFTYVMKKDKE